MAMYDHGGGCACGLYKNCNCNTNSQMDGTSLKNVIIENIKIKNYNKNEEDKFIIKSFLWTKKVCEEIYKARGNPESILSKIDNDTIVNLIRNNLHIKFEK